MSAPPFIVRVDDDDEDLDDLDDVLNQFNTAPPKGPTSISTSATSASSISAKSPLPSSTTSTPVPPPPPPPSTATIPSSTFPTDSDDVGEEHLDSAFARELQKGMESLMREMGGLGGDVLNESPSLSGRKGGSDTQGAGGKTEKEREQERMFKAAWEAMLVEDMDGMVADEYKPGALPAFAGNGSGSGGATSGTTGTGARAGSTSGATTMAGKGKGKVVEGAGGVTTGEEDKQDFKAGIRAAMEKLKSSESGFKDGAAAPSDPFEVFLSQLNTAGLGDLSPEVLANAAAGEDGEENEEEIQGMLEMMMSSLMSKEVLYEPLKELGDKFPPYLSENATKLSTEDKTRYESQLDRINKILKVFEDPKYSDQDKEESVKVVELMAEMQSFGTPPTEIMGDLPPGFNLGADGMPQMPEGCCIS